MDKIILQSDSLCSECGCELPKGSFAYTDGYDNLRCVDCYEKNNKHYCVECEREVEKYVKILRADTGGCKIFQKTTNGFKNVLAAGYRCRAYVLYAAGLGLVVCFSACSRALDQLQARRRQQWRPWTYAFCSRSRQ